MKLKLPFVHRLYTNMNEISSVCHHGGIWCQQRRRNIFEDLGNQLYTMHCKLMCILIVKASPKKQRLWYFIPIIQLKRILFFELTDFIFKYVLKLIHSICRFTLHTGPQLDSWFLNCVKRSHGTQMTRLCLVKFFISTKILYWP